MVLKKKRVKKKSDLTDQFMLNVSFTKGGKMQLQLQTGKIENKNVPQLILTLEEINNRIKKAYLRETIFKPKETNHTYIN